MPGTGQMFMKPGVWPVYSPTLLTHFLRNRGQTSRFILNAPILKKGPLSVGQNKLFQTLNAGDNENNQATFNCPAYTDILFSMLKRQYRKCCGWRKPAGRRRIYGQVHHFREFSLRCG